MIRISQAPNFCNQVCIQWYSISQCRLTHELKRVLVIYILCLLLLCHATGLHLCRSGINTFYAGTRRHCRQEHLLQKWTVDGVPTLRCQVSKHCQASFHGTSRKHLSIRSCNDNEKKRSCRLSGAKLLDNLEPKYHNTLPCKQHNNNVSFSKNETNSINAGRSTSLTMYYPKP